MREISDNKAIDFLFSQKRKGELCSFEKINENISICNGDSMKILEKIKESSCDCVITDPPYFLDGLGNNWNPKKIETKIIKAGVVGSLPVGMKFDVKQGKDLQNFMSRIARKIYRILKPGGFFLCFSQGRLYHRMGVAVEDSGFEIRDMLIWKRNGQSKAFSQNHFVEKMKISNKEKETIISSMNNRKTPQLRGISEPIVLAQKPKEGTFVQNWMKYGVGLIDTTISLDGKFPSTIIDVEKPNLQERMGSSHITIKPIQLMEHLIKIFSSEGSVICDPFLGSGSTGIACVHTNRKFIGIEINKKYYKEAKTRIINSI